MLRLSQKFYHFLERTILDKPNWLLFLGSKELQCVGNFFVQACKFKWLSLEDFVVVTSSVFKSFTKPVYNNSIFQIIVDLFDFISG